MYFYLASTRLNLLEDKLKAVLEGRGFRPRFSVNHFQSLTTEVDVHLSVARNPRINLKQADVEV